MNELSEDIEKALRQLGLKEEAWEYDAVYTLLERFYEMGYYRGKEEGFMEGLDRGNIYE